MRQFSMLTFILYFEKILRYMLGIVALYSELSLQNEDNFKQIFFFPFLSKAKYTQ